ncbi:MAG: hypothetical protein D4R45_00330 [Planctomycetaceae bacterium]|nr:MAG: hypothetical protein D4R45_00330 [Planctomycetaceae bacterium]
MDSGFPLHAKDILLQSDTAILNRLGFSIARLTEQTDPMFTIRYCQMLCMEFFGAQNKSRFSDCFHLFISPTSKARFGKVLVLGAGTHLASAGA